MIRARNIFAAFLLTAQSVSAQADDMATGWATCIGYLDELVIFRLELDGEAAEGFQNDWTGSLRGGEIATVQTLDDTLSEDDIDRIIKAGSVEMRAAIDGVKREEADGTQGGAAQGVFEGLLAGCDALRPEVEKRSVQ